MVITTPKGSDKQSAPSTSGPAGQDASPSSTAANIGTNRDNDPPLNSDFPPFNPLFANFGRGFGRGRSPPQQETVSLEGNDGPPNFHNNFPNFGRPVTPPPPPNPFGDGPGAHPDPPLANFPFFHPRGPGPHPPMPFPGWFDPAAGANLANTLGQQARNFAGLLANELGFRPGPPHAGPHGGPPSPPHHRHHPHGGPGRGGFGFRGGRGGWCGPGGWPGGHHHGGPWHDHGPILPRMDIYRTESTYTVTMELPGLKKQDVDISVQDGKLTISGEFVTAPNTEEPSPPEMEPDYGYDLMGEDVVFDDGETLSDDKDDKDEEKKKGCFVVRERRSGKFKRSIRLPSWVQVEEIKATMEHGVLKIVFEKPQPENTARKVSIL